MPEVTLFQPDWASLPGETISDILRERNVSVSDFAERIGKTQEQAADLLLGRSAITIRTARQLAEVLGGSVEFWIARDYRYRQKIARPSLADNAWLRNLPLAEMAEFGWVETHPEQSQQIAACLSFFGVPNVAAWHRVYGAIGQKFAFRTSPTFESHPAAVAAWLRQGEREAEQLASAPWNARGFKTALSSIRSLTREKDPKQFVPKLQNLCAEAGVAAVIVRCLRRCRASGATRFLRADKALLLLSFRYLSDDQFWFSFFHEAGHLLLHGRQELFIEGMEGQNASAEQEANDFAVRTLIPPPFQPEFSRLRPNAYDIVRFARRVGVSPGILVGQLQHRGRIRYNHFNGLKRWYEWE